MAYSVVTRERMTSESVSAARLSEKYLPSGTATAIENGNVVVIGSLVSGEREVYTATTPTATTSLSAIGLVTTPEVIADERKKNLDEFRNEAGDIITVDKLFSGDVFSVTADGLTGTKAVGDIVELQAGTKLNTATTLTASSTKVGTLIDIANGNYAIQVA
jgi:predicted transcriptional regulator of viral defense system